MRLIVFLLTFINGVSAAQWRVAADVPLPGKPGRFDYQSFDSATGRHDLHTLRGTLSRWRTHKPVRELLPHITRVLHNPAG